jgi:FixJ family two-component response regulator
MTASGPVIAIVDDDELVRRALRRLIGSFSFQAREFSSGEEFLAELANFTPACVLLDLHMPGVNGLELLAALRAGHFEVPTIIITGNAQREMRTLCIGAGAVAYLQKPLDRNTVLSTIRSAIAK